MDDERESKESVLTVPIDDNDEILYHTKKICVRVREREKERERERERKREKERERESYRLSFMFSFVNCVVVINKGVVFAWNVKKSCLPQETICQQVLSLSIVHLNFSCV